MATHVRFSLPSPLSQSPHLPPRISSQSDPPSASLQILYESATGLALFSSEFAEEIGAKGSQQVQQSVEELAKFSKMVKLVSFVPFQDAAHALEVANDVSEGTFPISLGPKYSGRSWPAASWQPAPRSDLC